MGKQEDTKGITVKKEQDMPEWYTQVCLKAELADYAPVKGCMVIRPLGYALWQELMNTFNKMLVEDKVQNAYFPLFIPESFFSREAEHAEGFSPEVAWVEQKDSKKHQERLAIRPTSETIIYDSYSRWIKSWRDLPLRINQWANIVRWEVQDVKLFLRSREFLWQEGHCVYETEKECHAETLHFLERYRQIAEELLAIPVILGKKTEQEKFAGAISTYTLEALMPDGKALQLGTSHDLSQGFAKSFSISFQGRDGKDAKPWQNSWGISTRMIGAVILLHGDDRGLVLPPTLAPNKIAIVPILFEKGKENIIKEAEKLGKTLECFNPIIDTREEYSSGWKFNQYELQGVPIRVEIGPKDIEKKQVVLVRRDTGAKEFIPLGKVEKKITEMLEEIQKNLFSTARKMQKEKTITVNSFKEFEKAIKNRKMILSSHCGKEECEFVIKEKTAATARCIPLKEKDADPAGAKCIHCGKAGKYNVYFARAY